MTSAQPPVKKVGALPAGPPVILPIQRAAPRGGCARWLVVLLAAPFALALGLYTLAYLSLLPARSECAAIAPGTLAADAEARLHRELGASRTGYGGPTGGPISEIDVGHRGALLSWECAMRVDATEHVTGVRFVPWIAVRLPGGHRVEAWLESLLPR